MYSIFWGILALAWLKALYPKMSGLIERVPNRIGVPLTWVLVVFMAGNILISAAAVERMSDRHIGEPAQTRFDVFLDKTYPDDFMKKISI